jgi:hypothetical protein
MEDVIQSGAYFLGLAVLAIWVWAISLLIRASDLTTPEKARQILWLTVPMALLCALITATGFAPFTEWGCM